MKKRTIRLTLALRSCVAGGLTDLAVAAAPVPSPGAATHTGSKIENNSIVDTRTTGGFPGPAISLESASSALSDRFVPAIASVAAARFFSRPRC